MKNRLIQSILKSVVTIQVLFLLLGIFLVILDNTGQQELIRKISRLLLK